MSFSFKLSVDEVVNAIRTGNAAVISRYFDNTVDITLPDKSNSFSRSQGEMVLRDFFLNNSVRSFNVIHKGDNSGAKYCIGTLSTRSGIYRTTIYLKQKGDRQVVQEIRFESQ
jgi:hypothetical protein